MNTENHQMYEWTDINWHLVEKCVFKLQKRIYKASQSGSQKLVRKLQRLMVTSWYAKLWAVRKVTQDNQGKNTAGVDGVKKLAPNKRIALAKNLKLSGKAKPARRVWIPKPGTDEKRPLGIPTMYDRALQALVTSALEPEWEAKFEPNSYGFRPGRSAHDAIEAIFSTIKQKAKYALDADIAKCFDRINQEKLLEKINTSPTLKRQIKAWLKAGVIDEGIFNTTDKGTPQGGVISPLLANIALHGMETTIKNFAGNLKGKGSKRNKMNAISLIRYADDFVILHEDLEMIHQCQEIIQQFLLEIGLELKPSKTKIVHSSEGFDFLGFTIRQFSTGKNHTGKSTKGTPLGFKTIIKPSKTKIKIHNDKLKEVVRSSKSLTQAILISKLNPIIKGWSRYYSTVCSKETFDSLDHDIYLKLRRWTKRRHPNKGLIWIKNKYWPGKDWTFRTKDGLKLTKHADQKIERHIKVQGERSPYDGDLTYWSTRMGRHPELTKQKASLLKKQKGICPHCKLAFKDGDLLEVDHIIPKVLGGSNKYDNIQLLHRHCHDEKSKYDGSLEAGKLKKAKRKATKELSEKSGPCVKGKVREEPCEVKVSSTVLKTSQRGDSLA